MSGNNEIRKCVCYLTQDDLWCSVEPGLDVGVNSLMFITAGTKVYDLETDGGVD